MSRVFFFGGGRITNAIVGGLEGISHGLELVVYDRNPSKLRQFQKHTSAQVTSELKSAKDVDFLVLAVRPQNARAAIQELGPASSKLPALSLCAGISIRELQHWSRQAGSRMFLARAMPSPACRTRNGLTAVCFSRQFPRAVAQRIRRMFATLGMTVELREAEFDAFTVVYSPTHGQHALATLTSAAEEMGLDSTTAILAAAHALGDSINDWRARGMPKISEVLREAATPGGIAAATMAAMEKAGSVRSIRKGLKAGMQRLREVANSDS